MDPWRNERGAFKEFRAYKMKHILVTNDDGVPCARLLALVRKCENLASDRSLHPTGTGLVRACKDFGSRFASEGVSSGRWHVKPSVAMALLPIVWRLPRLALIKQTQGAQCDWLVCGNYVGAKPGPRCKYPGPLPRAHESGDRGVPGVAVYLKAAESMWAILIFWQRAFFFFFFFFFFFMAAR